MGGKYFSFETENGYLKTVTELTAEEYADYPSTVIDVFLPPVTADSNGRVIISLPEK